MGIHTSDYEIIRMVCGAPGVQGLGTKTIKAFASRMLDLNTNNGILVYRANISAIARQLLQVRTHGSTTTFILVCPKSWFPLARM